MIAIMVIWGLAVLMLLSLLLTDPYYDDERGDMFRRMLFKPFRRNRDV